MNKHRKWHRFRRLAASGALTGAMAVVLSGHDAYPASKPSLSKDLTAPRSTAPLRLGASPHADGPNAGKTCDEGLVDAARRNREGLSDLTFAAFHRVVTGWEIYEPLIARELGTRCGGATPAFARILAAWQSIRGLRISGLMDETTFTAMYAEWERRRPFVAASRHRCPSAPPEASLALVPANESYSGKSMLLRPAALAAYGRMLAAARAEGPEMNADRRLMTLFSAYRGVDSDAARCASDGNCQGIARTTCSAHLTGLAIDLDLGAAPGDRPDSSNAANRLYISRGVAYRWMVVNAWRFGFVPYAFEPWHWEWTGEPIEGLGGPTSTEDGPPPAHPTSAAAPSEP